jgi:hypothetical protein
MIAAVICRTGEWHGGDLVRVDQDVEAVRGRDAAAGGDEGLCFDRFVAVTGVQDRGAQAAWWKTSHHIDGSGELSGAD